MKKFKRLIALVSTVAMAVSTFVPFMTASAATESSNLVTATETLLDLQFNSADDAAGYEYKSAVDGVSDPTGATSAGIREGFLDIYYQDSYNVVYFPLSKAMNIEGEDNYTIKTRVKMPSGLPWRRVMGLVDSSRIGAAGQGGVWHRYNETFVSLYHDSGVLYGQEDNKLAYGADVWNDVTIEFADGNVTYTVEYEGATGKVKDSKTVALSTLTTNGGEGHYTGRTYDKIMMSHYDLAWTRIMVDYITVEREYQYDPYNVELLNLQFESTDDLTKLSHVLGGGGGTTSAEGLSSKVSVSGGALDVYDEGHECAVYVPLSEAIDLSSSNKYTVKIRTKLASSLYRVFGLADTSLLGTANSVSDSLYGRMYESFMIMFHSAGTLSLDDSNYLASGGSSVWSDVEWVFENGNVTMTVSYEGESGTVTNSYTKTLADLTKNNFGHKSGATYDRLIFGNSSAWTHSYYDYIQVTKVIDPYAPADVINLQFNSADDADAFSYVVASDATSTPTGNSKAYIDGNGNLDIYCEGHENMVYIPLSEEIDLEGTNKYAIKMRAKFPTSLGRVFGLTNTSLIGTGNSVSPSPYGRFYESFLLMTQSSGNLVLDSTATVPYGGADVWSDIEYVFEDGNITMTVTYGDVTTTKTTTLAANTKAGFGHKAGQTYDKLVLSNYTAWTHMYIDYIQITRTTPNPYNEFPETDGEYILKLGFNDEADAEGFAYKSGADGKTDVTGSLGSATVNTEEGYFDLYYRASDNVVYFPLEEAIDLDGEDAYQIQMRGKFPNTYRFLGLVNSEKIGSNTNPSPWGRFAESFTSIFMSSGQMSLDDATYDVYGGSSVWADLVLTYNKGKIKLNVKYEENGEIVENVLTANLSDRTSGSFKHNTGVTYDNLILWNATDYSHMLIDYIAVVKNPTLPVENYTVKFVDHDGTVLSEQTIDEGYNATAPAEPSREGYLFTGWDKAYTNVQSDLTINAVYKKIELGVTETIADYKFDDINNKTGITGLTDGISWISNAGYLSMVKNPAEVPVFLQLDEAIDLSKDFVYTVETMVKVPTVNYRWMSLSNIVSGELVYQAMVNHFLLARHDTTTGDEKGVSLAQFTSPIGSATSDEWRKLTYTFTKDTYIFEAIVYNADGSVKSDESITGDLSKLMTTGNGTGKHKEGKKYTQVAFGNINGGTTYVDYVKVTRLAPSETTPMMTELAFADGAGNTMSYASPRTAAAKAVFSQPMDIASFTEDTFVVTNENGEIIEGNGSLSEDKLTYTYTFDNALALGGKITVKATNGLKSLADEYVAYGNRLSFDVINHIELLNEDFEDGLPTLVAFNGSATVTLGEEDGNKFANADGNWCSSGYLFSRPIAYNETNTYRFAFDFKLDEPASYGSGQESYASLHDSLANYSSGEDEAYNNLNLLGFNAETFKFANSVAIPGDAPEFDVWYSYELLLKRDSGAYEIKITKRGEKDVVAGGSGLVINAAYGGLSNRNYNAFKFSRKGTWSVDNIVVEQVVENPIVVSAKTAKVGNIYGTNDDIVFDVTVANDSSSVVNVKVDYTVTDFDGNVIETGSVVGSQDIPELGSFGKRITINNATDFDVYEIHFNTNAYVVDDDEEFDITSLKYMFSRVNTKDAGDPTNKFLAVNQALSADQGEEFAKMMADAGIGGVRATFNWHHFEKLGEEGKSARDPQYDLAGHLKENGVDVMAIFTDLNPNYTITYGNWEENVEDIYIKYMNGDCTQIEWDRAYNAFLAHVRWLVAEYADEIDYWEVFNESYSRMYHPAEDYTYEITAEHYLETYVKPVKAIVDELDPTAEVVGICTDGVMFEFVSACIKHMGNDWPQYVDSISVHPYDWAFDNVNYRSGLAGTFGTWSVIIRDYQFEYLVNQIKDVWMEEYITNGTKIPVHYTEIGLASTKGYASFRMQAAELVQINAMTQGRDYAESIWWYNFENRDVRGDDWSTDIFNSADPRNGNYGWVGHKNDTVPYAAKPIYVAAATYNKFLTNAEVKGMITNGDMIEWYQAGFETRYRGNENGMSRAVGFTATNGDDVLVIWNDELTNEVKIAGWGELKVYDMFGNLVGTHNCGSNGESPLTITSSFAPLYVVGAMGDNVIDRVSFDNSDITVENAREEVVVGHEYTITITDALARDLTLEIEASPYLNIVENNGFVDGVATIKVIPTADAYEEEQISIKVMNGNEMVHYVNGYADVAKATYGNITANDTKLSSVNGFDVLKNAEILSVQLHGDNLLRLGSTLNVNVMVAYYDANGALIEADEANQSFELSGLSTLDIPVSVPTNCARIKVMLWDATGLMMPYDFALDYID